MRTTSTTLVLAVALSVGASSLAFAQSGKPGGDPNNTGLSPSGKMDGAKKQQSGGMKSGDSGGMKKGGSGSTSTGSPASDGMTK